MDRVPGGGMLHGHRNHHRPLVGFEETGLKSNSPIYAKTPQLNTGQDVNLETVYRSLLNIIARLEEKQYTQSVLRQTTEVVLDDLADPASAANTSQG
jgi:hypothetical protein